MLAPKRSRKRAAAQTIPPCHSILLGQNHEKRSLGFTAASGSEVSVGEAVNYTGDAHLCTVAPTRSGKGVGVIIPNLLTYTGPVVVFDPKGENYNVTARRRREMGHRVIKLDPFGVTEGASDALNPLDLLDLPAAGDVDSNAQTLAELLATGIHGHREPFWDISGIAFASGLIAMAATQGNVAHRNLNHVVEKLTASDAVHGLAVVLDTIGKKLCKLAFREIACVLQMPDVTRGGVLATTQSYFKPFLNDCVASCLEKSSFSLKDVVDGAPLSIYIMLPPNRMRSHRGLLKLWVGTLMAAIFTRQSRPEAKTLFLLDEVAQLESFPLLESLLTLAGGYSVWVHAFWQDLAQLKTCYPDSWKTILNNCGVIQAFGFNNRDMATQWGDYFDHGAHQLRAMNPGEQILSIQGQGESICERLHYLKDPRFAGMFDANPMHTPKGRRPGLQAKPPEPGPSSPSL